MALAFTAVAACDSHEPLRAYKGKPKVHAAPGQPGDAKAGFDAGEATKPVAVSPAALLERARPILGALAAEATSPNNPCTDAKVELGHVLYFDPRLSRNQELSCNSCHDLATYGIDPRMRDGVVSRTSGGHGNQFGERNSPTVYNAAFHAAQFWDGRAADVEDQAGMPILNPIEMAMPDEASVVAVLESIPGYAEKFAAAFPGEDKPVNFANLRKALGAFERKLVTPAAFDRFMTGDLAALDEAQLVGLQAFLDVGCTQCHSGPLLGGMQFQKLGSVKPWPDLKDEGRAAHTKSPLDRFMFKVPSLRNVAKTGPYLHDGSIGDLSTMVDRMAEFQAARGKLTPAETRAIVAFLDTLTGELPSKWIKAPALPESGPQTPKANAG